MPYPFHGSGRVIRGLLGDWQVNALAFWQTGSLFAITSNVTQNGRAYINLPTVTSDRPNRVPGVSLYSSNRSATGGYLNSVAFARQSIGTAGDVGRNIVYGPHQRRPDLSLFKTLPIHENLALQLRAECFNISNTPNFAQPSGAINKLCLDAGHEWKLCRDGRGKFWN
jgi:hypothetical protein